MEVALIRWPEESSRREDAREAHAPRLLIVDPVAEPPHIEDPLEDWVRLPAADRDVRARVRTLMNRAAESLRPSVDPDGVLRYGEGWVPLSPVEAALGTVLADRYETVVGREALMRAAWPEDPPSRNALDVHVLRLRRRIEPLGLEIKTVRARGYLLQSA